MTYNEYAQVLEAKNPKTGALYTPADFNVVNYNDVGVGMLQDAVWADGKKLASDTDVSGHHDEVPHGVDQGLDLLPDNAAEVRRPRGGKGSKLGKSHQLWQMNEINKLVWPSAKGIGILDTAAWDRR